MNWGAAALGPADAAVLAPRFAAEPGALPVGQRAPGLVGELPAFEPRFTSLEPSGLPASQRSVPDARPNAAFLMPLGAVY